MSSTTKAILIVAVVAFASFFIGMIAYGVFGLEEVLINNAFLATVLGSSMSGFGMMVALIATMGTLFLVPSVRHEFVDAFTAGSDFKKSKGSRGGRF